MTALMLLTFLKHAKRVASSALSPDGKKLALAVIKDRETRKLPAKFSRFLRVIVVETATGELLHEADMGEKRLDTGEFALALSQDGKLLAAGGSWTVQVWSVGDPKVIWRGEGGQEPFKSLAFSPDGKRIAATNEDKGRLIWELSKN